MLGKHGSSKKHSSYFDYEKFHSFASPSTHDVVVQPQSDMDTKRLYDRGRQRGRLWRLSIGEFLVTLALCLAIFGLLFGYHRKATLDRDQKRWFNALVTGLSVALGINLAASLRSYAKMLRWRLLAGTYRSLSQFELLLGADSQTNILQLFWTEFSRSDRRHKFIPSGTQILCVLWIVINLAATIIVACLGLTYGLDQSNSFVSTQRGPTSIIDWSYFGTADGLQQAQSMGNQAYESYPPINAFQASNEIAGQYEAVGDGFSRYWFTDYNPQDSYQNVQTYRYVNTYAQCEAHEVVEGNEGYLPYVVYRNGSHNVRVNFPTPVTSDGGNPGGLVFISELNETCGPRCTNVNVFQAKSDPNDVEDQFFGVIFTTVSKAQFFTCNNTVSEVMNVPSYDHAKDYAMSDYYARVLAGAVGWSGETPRGDSQQYKLYDETTNVVQSTWSHATNASTAVQVASIISGFSAGAMAQANTAASPATKVAYGDKPIYADYLKVDWPWAGGLLGAIPIIHFGSLLMVIMWANKAVIKDDSHLAVAKLYYPLIQRLGDHGCIMRGEHIVKKLGDPQVVYGWKEGDSGVKHADIFEPGSGVEVQSHFEPGVYDGGMGSSKMRGKDKTD